MIECCIFFSDCDLHLIGLDAVTNRDNVVDHLIDGQRGSLTHNLENTRKRYSYQSDPNFGLDGLRLACPRKSSGAPSTLGPGV